MTNTRQSFTYKRKVGRSEFASKMHFLKTVVRIRSKYGTFTKSDIDKFRLEINRARLSPSQRRTLINKLNEYLK